MLFLFLVLYIVTFLLLVNWNASIGIAFAFVTSILFRIYLPTIKGYIGEKRVNQMLRKLGDGYLIYPDIYVEKKDGKTAQIDHVVLSKYGIFVIETKNYKGWIFGNETQKNWTQVIYKKKTRFYNPILQNQTHIRALKAYLNMDKSFYSIIVFSNEATLKFENNFLEAKVIKNNQLLKVLRKFDTPQFSPQQLHVIQQKMNNLIVNDKKLKSEIKKNHIQQIKTNGTKKQPKINSNAIEKRKICVKCGNQMQLKKGKFGEFYGCIDYPTCRYTEKVT